MRFAASESKIIVVNHALFFSDLALRMTDPSSGILPAYDHVVFDDGSVDTGTLAAGTLSQPITIGVGNRSYHCAIHPSMVGSIAVLSTLATQTMAASE